MLAFTPWGKAGWGIQYADTYDGVDAAKHSTVNYNQMAGISFTVTGPGALDFYWRYTSGGSPYAFLYLDYGLGVGGGVNFNDGVWRPHHYQIDTVGPRTLSFTILNGNSSGTPVVGVVDQLSWTFGTATNTVTPSITDTFSHSPTRTLTGTPTPTPSTTPTWTVSPTFSASPTPSLDLYDAIDNWSLPISTSGAVWSFQTLVSSDGTDAVEMAALSPGQTGTFSVTVSGPGALGYDYRMDGSFDPSSYSCFNTLLDGADQELGCYISPSSPQWYHRSVYIPAGTHTYTWSFSRAFGSTVSTRAWIDGVTFIFGTPTITPTFSVTPTFTLTPTPGSRPETLYSFPNPGRVGQRITFVYPPAASAELEIYDINLHRITQGGPVSVLPEKGWGYWTPAGRFMDQGIYFARVQTDRGAYVCKFSLY